MDIVYLPTVRKRKKTENVKKQKYKYSSCMCILDFFYQIFLTKINCKEYVFNKKTIIVDN